MNISAYDVYSEVYRVSENEHHCEDYCLRDLIGRQSTHHINYAADYAGNKSECQKPCV